MNKFIGSGITFPILLNDSGRPDLTNGIELIISSMTLILNWPTNTRFFNEKFGNRLEELLDEPNDGVTRSLLNTFVRNALLQEKRVVVNKVDIYDYDNYRVNIRINFKIRDTQIEETLIFPYYKTIS